MSISQFYFLFQRKCLWFHLQSPCALRLVPICKERVVTFVKRKCILFTPMKSARLLSKREMDWKQVRQSESQHKTTWGPQGTRVLLAEGGASTQMSKEGGTELQALPPCSLLHRLQESASWGNCEPNIRGIFLLNFLKEWRNRTTQNHEDKN